MAIVEICWFCDETRTSSHLGHIVKCCSIDHLYLHVPWQLSLKLDENLGLKELETVKFVLYNQKEYWEDSIPFV